jgi:CRP-like cAMP-binding protein
MEQKQFAAGECIFEENAAGDTAFLLASGVIEISRAIDGEDTVLGEIEAGQIFGEMALISDQPRTATARAKQDSVCFLMPQEAFESELNGSSAFLKSLVANLIRHIRSLMVQLDEASANPDAAQLDVIFHQPESFNSYKVKE